MVVLTFNSWVLSPIRKVIKSKELRWAKRYIRGARKILGNGYQTEQTNGQIVLRVHFREAAYKDVRWIYLLTTQCSDFFFGKPRCSLLAFRNTKFLQQLIKCTLAKGNNIVLLQTLTYDTSFTYDTSNTHIWHLKHSHMTLQTFTYDTSNTHIWHLKQEYKMNKSILQDDRGTDTSDPGTPEHYGNNITTFTEFLRIRVLRPLLWLKQIIDNVTRRERDCICCLQLVTLGSISITWQGYLFYEAESFLIS
jgi:hypothetical protein